MHIWDNPWYGNTKWKVDKDFNDVNADCGSEGASADGSVFGPQNLQKPQPFDLHITAVGYTEGGGSFRKLTAGDLANMGLLPWSFIGIGGIMKDPVMWTEFTGFAPSPQFGDLGTETVVPLTNAVAANWAGEWSSDMVDVKITQAASDSLQIRVSDKTANPTLEFTELFAIGDRSRILQSALGSVSTLTGQGYNDTLTRALKLTVSIECM